MRQEQGAPPEASLALLLQERADVWTYQKNISDTVFPHRFSWGSKLVVELKRYPARAHEADNHFLALIFSKYVSVGVF